VDGLHEKAGSKAIEMHGSLNWVVCQSCNMVHDRHEFQISLELMNSKIYSWAVKNPDMIMADVSSSVNPDGDVDFNWDYSEILYPNCSSCQGVLKPNVVFFGENIPGLVRDQTFQLVDDADLLVIIGSSLTVYSALRLVKRANDRKIPVAILNQGLTRGDQLASFLLKKKIEDVLPKLV
jgi:NAD-dependent deacetylase sirtuin 4